MQACSDRPALAGSADRDCNSNEVAKCLLLLTLAERPAVADGGDGPVAPPRRRRSKPEKELRNLLERGGSGCSSAADGGSADGSAAATPRCSGSESEEVSSWNLKAAGRCVRERPDAGELAQYADAPPPSSTGGTSCCAGSRRCCAVAELALAGAASAQCAADASCRRLRCSAPDGCEDEAALARAAAEGDAAATSPSPRGGGEPRREARPSPPPPSLRRLSCEGCAADAEPGAESSGEQPLSPPPDSAAVEVSCGGCAAAAAAYPPGQTVVVLRRKTQRVVDVARRRSSRLSQHKRVSAAKVSAAGSVLAEKAASLRQKFTSLKARAKGMQQKDTEIKVKFQDLQKRRNVLKSLSRTSVVRASKLGAALLELGGTAALV